MNTNKKPVFSLLIALVLILPFSLHTLATAEKEALAQELFEESIVNELSPDSEQLSTSESLVVVEEPQLEPDLELGLEPDPNPDELSLAASGQETPAAGPTITPFATKEFNIVGLTGYGKLMIDSSGQGKMLFVNESGISFKYSSLAYGEPYRYTTPSPDWDTIEGDHFTIDLVSRLEGIFEYSLEAALAEDVNGSSGRPQSKWRYDNAQVYILIQRVESFTRVSEPTNPTAIEVGRTDDDYSGDNTSDPWEYTWTIMGPGGYSLSGSYTDGLGATGDLPTAAELYALLPGDYTVTTIAKEFFPTDYANIDSKGDSVTHITTANFAVTVGDVIVEHIDENGNPIPGVTAPTINRTYKGDSYTTTPENIPGYTFVAAPSNKDGLFTDADQTVTYKYRKVMTEVKVEHVYEDDGSPVVPHASPTTGHATIETIPTNQLSQKDIAIVDVEVDGFSQGNTADYLVTYPPSGVTTVIYVYKRVMTEVTVKHVYTDGTEVLGHPPVIISGQVGTTTPTSKLTGETIDKVLIGTTPTGNTNDVVATFPDTGTTTVTYVYEKPTAPIAKGTLELKHIFLDENGIVVSTPATATNNYTGDVGSAYNTTALISTAITRGYRLAQAKLPVNASGMYKTTLTVVEYYYEPIPKIQPGQGSVTTIHTIQHTDGSATTYVTEDPIIDVIGNPYTTAAIVIPGYILKEVPSNNKGNIATGNQTVTYVYIPDPIQAQLTEQHLIIDEAGKVIGIIDIITTARPDGTPYTTSAKTPVGYKLSRAPANANGIYKTGAEQVVSYYYAKIADPVTPNPDPSTGGGSQKVFPTSIANAKPTGEGAATNPQTGDSTNQENILSILYIVLIASLALFVLIILVPIKKQKR